MILNKKIPLMIVMFFFMFLSVFYIQLTGAYLTTQEQLNPNIQIGGVDVEVQIYFEQGTQIKDRDLFYTPVDGFTKNGVYFVNISNVNDIQFFDNLRVNIIISSNVDTYFRVLVCEQLTMLYTSNDILREVAVTYDGYMPFNYNFATFNQEQLVTNGFYDNRIVDGYLYYTNKVKRINQNQPLIIPLIVNSNDTFSPYGERYRLQLGFIIEAVQFLDGAQHNWLLANTPWGTDW